MAKKNENQPSEEQLNIELSDEVAEGQYANLAVISHSNTEFVVDFIKIMPGLPQAKVKSRIILTPQHAKRFLRALSDNLNRYEAMNGRIEESNDMNDGVPMFFGGGGEA